MSPDDTDARRAMVRRRLNQLARLGQGQWRGVGQMQGHPPVVARQCAGTRRISPIAVA